MADDDLPRLTDDEKAAVAALLKRTIDADRYPLSPRIGTLRGILAKLEPAETDGGAAESVSATATHRKAAARARLIEILGPAGDTRQHRRGRRAPLHADAQVVGA